MASALAISQYNGIDRSERARVTGQFRQDPKHGLLARVSDIQPGITLSLALVNQIWQVIHLLSEYVKVDQAVPVVQTVSMPFGLVHGGRERLPDARTDQPDKYRGIR
jgi:hypothetical protein